MKIKEIGNICRLSNSTFITMKENTPKNLCFV